MNGFRFFNRKHTPVILQSEATECGLACIAMISAFHGKYIDLPVMRNRFPVSLQGATVKQMLGVATDLQMEARALRAELESLADIKLPAILHWDFNHFVVMEKIDRDFIYVIDPAVGCRRLSRQELGEHFTGVAVELSPGSEFSQERVQRKLKLWPIFKAVQGLKKSLVNIFVLALVLQVFSMLAPVFMQLVIDHAVVAHDQHLLAVLAFGFLLLGLIQIVVGFIRSWLVLVLGTSLDFQLQRTLFSHLLSLPIVFFEKRHLGDVI